MTDDTPISLSVERRENETITTPYLTENETILSLSLTLPLAEAKSLQVHRKKHSFIPFPFFSNFKSLWFCSCYQTENTEECDIFGLERATFGLVRFRSGLNIFN